jgi:pyruvate formate lyase activating enzyme
VSIKLFQTGWNYSQDGPGNRLLLHFQGCNFDCPWCSNPEGRSLQGEIFVRKDLLTPGVCPHGAIHQTQLNRTICISCNEKECLTSRKNKGISFTSRDYEVPELVQMASESQLLFYDGGGVTITGGEATLQFEDLSTLLEQLKSRDIHTALETNGSHKDLQNLFAFLDLLIFDIKHWDFSKAAPLIKNKGPRVIENLERACRSSLEILARITLIPGFNDSPEDMKHFARMIAGMNPGENFSLELLEFHEFGRQKWDAIGQKYRGPLAEHSTTSASELEQYKSIFKTHGIQCVTT